MVLDFDLILIGFGGKKNRKNTKLIPLLWDEIESLSSDPYCTTREWFYES